MLKISSVANLSILCWFLKVHSKSKCLWDKHKLRESNGFVDAYFNFLTWLLLRYIHYFQVLLLQWILFFPQWDLWKRWGVILWQVSSSKSCSWSAKPVRQWRLFDILVGNEGLGRTALHPWNWSAYKIWGKLKLKARHVCFDEAGKGNWGLHKLSNISWEGGCPAAIDAKRAAEVGSTRSKNNRIVYIFCGFTWYGNLKELDQANCKHENSYFWTHAVLPMPY